MQPSSAHNALTYQTTSYPTMSFQQILAIPIANTPQQTGPPPPTQNRRGHDILLRNMSAHAQTAENLSTLYALIASGDMPDPYPHYLWAESRGLITWVLEMLTTKLNALLDYEAQGRQKMKLVRSNKAGRAGDHEDLARWCRTGQRKNIRFRMYPDWLPILESLDLDAKADLRISDMMMLITEAHRRVFGGAATANIAPRLQALAPKSETQFSGVGQQQNQQAFTSSDSGPPPTSKTQQTYASQGSFNRTSFPVFRDVGQPSELATGARPGVFRDSTNLPTVPRQTSIDNMVHDVGSRVRLMSDGNGEPQSALGKRKAYADVEDAERRLKVARSHEAQPDVRTAEVIDTDGMDDLIDPTLLCSSSSVAPQDRLNEDFDLRAYLEYLRNDFSQQPEDFEDIDTINTPLPPDPTAMATNHWLNEQIKPVKQQLSPLRCLPAPMAGDYSQLARCVRFAQLDSQKDIKWRIYPSHVEEIGKRANWYGMELLQGRTHISLGETGPHYSRMEFEAILAIRFAKVHSGRDHTVACIGMIADVLEKEASPGYILSLLTEEDMVRFARHVAALKDRHEAQIGNMNI